MARQLSMPLAGKTSARGERSISQRGHAALRPRSRPACLLPSRAVGFRTLQRLAPRSTSNGTEAEVAEIEGDVQKQPEEKKYYRTMPGFPNVMVEFDEPEVDDKPKGTFVWWKFLLLCGGVVLMFAEVTTFAMVAMR